jgi:predicted Rossmann fold nucleotide-binding protein DprA/Smf involved in DNA uptake
VIAYKKPKAYPDWRKYANLSDRCKSVLTLTVRERAVTVAGLMVGTALSHAQVIGALLTLDKAGLVTWSHGSPVTPTEKGKRLVKAGSK